MVHTNRNTTRGGLTSLILAIAVCLGNVQVVPARADLLGGFEEASVDLDTIATLQPGQKIAGGFSAGKCDTFLANSNFEGHDMSTADAHSKEQCRDKCKERLGCNAFTYSRWGCFLKYIPKGTSPSHYGGAWSMHMCKRTVKCGEWLEPYAYKTGYVREWYSKGRLTNLIRLVDCGKVCTDPALKCNAVTFTPNGWQDYGTCSLYQVDDDTLPVKFSAQLNPRYSLRVC